MKIRKALLSYMSITIGLFLLSQISWAATNLGPEVAFASADSSITGGLSSGAVLGESEQTQTVRCPPIRRLSSRGSLTLTSSISLSIPSMDGPQSLEHMSTYPTRRPLPEVEVAAPIRR